VAARRLAAFLVYAEVGKGPPETPKRCAMKKPLFLLLPLLPVVACTDGTLFQPDATFEPAGEPAQVTASAQVALDARWEVEFFLAFKQNLQPIEPFGNAFPPVFHGRNVGNEFFLTGVLRTPEVEGPVSGLQYFFGDVNLNYANARGVQRGHSVRFVIEESPVGAGTWDCRATYVMKPYEGGGPVASGSGYGLPRNRRVRRDEHEARRHQRAAVAPGHPVQVLRSDLVGWTGASPPRPTQGLTEADLTRLNLETLGGPIRWAAFSLEFLASETRPRGKHEFACG
jgi:hypothetical protein